MTGQPVRSGELVKATAVEVAEYLKQYNELDDGEEKEKKEDGGGIGATATAAGREAFDEGAKTGEDTGGRREASQGGMRGGQQHKNAEGRVKETAPVASTGMGSSRLSSATKGG